MSDRLDLLIDNVRSQGATLADLVKEVAAMRGALEAVPPHPSPCKHTHEGLETALSTLKGQVDGYRADARRSDFVSVTAAALIAAAWGAFTTGTPL